eukprot:TRINITY_DN16655_c0_g1_i1.p1 TRINITY_DN16655_c0_g1~~TRINITY_DN16655_c0_g1_i1.p1  ORF type:complete len:463 (-),score=106.35 TRINITY_DN16655_c0_g1_i1:9-1226(-)
MKPVVRDRPLDVRFALALENVPRRELPEVEDIGMLVPLAVGQSLQVAPGDVMGEVIMHDADVYEGTALAAFELRRKDGEAPGAGADVAAAATAGTPSAPQAGGTPASASVPAAPAQASRAPTAAVASGPAAARAGSLAEAFDVAAGDRDRNASALSGRKKIGLLQRLRGSKRTSMQFETNQYARIQSLDASRRNRLFCTHCNVYVAIRCESWRIAPDGNQLLDALRDRSGDTVRSQLGLAGGWRVLQYSVVPQPAGRAPLEVVGITPSYRFEGYNWDYDPVVGNLSHYGEGLHRGGHPLAGMDDPVVMQVAQNMFFVGCVLFFFVMYAMYHRMGQDRPEEYGLDMSMMNTRRRILGNILKSGRTRNGGRSSLGAALDRRIGGGAVGGLRRGLGRPMGGTELSFLR